MKIATCLVFCIWASTISPLELFASTPNFRRLGGLPNTVINSRATDVSADGSVVVGFARSDDTLDFEAFRWTEATGMVGLGSLQGGIFETSRGYAISPDGGTIVGESRSALGIEAFQYTQSAGMTGIGNLSQGPEPSVAYGVAANGDVVVGASGNQAFRWTPTDGMVGIGDLPGGMDFSVSEAVSADGAVIVGSSRSSIGIEPFRWTEEDGMVGLGIDGIGWGVSQDGSVVVGEADPGPTNEAFVWAQDNGLTLLGDLPGGQVDSRAFDVSADGSVVVGQGRSANGREAFIWTKNDGMQSLQDLLRPYVGTALDGWQLEAATAISSDGRTIVGRGFNPNNQSEAWIAMVPEPSMATIFLVGSCVILSKRCPRNA